MTVETAAATAVFDRIVCGIDETPASLEAARQAARLRSPGGLLRLAAVADVDIAVHAGFRTSHVLEELDAAARAAEERFAGGDVPLPEEWGGYRVKPSAYEFWQHRENRLHDRLRYERAGEGWRIVRLGP